MGFMEPTQLHGTWTSTSWNQELLILSMSHWHSWSMALSSSTLACHVSTLWSGGSCMINSQGAAVLARSQGKWLQPSCRSMMCVQVYRRFVPQLACLRCCSSIVAAAADIHHIQWHQISSHFCYASPVQAVAQVGLASLITCTA